jgi:hypothetical protein
MTSVLEACLASSLVCQRPSPRRPPAHVTQATHRKAQQIPSFYGRLYGDRPFGLLPLLMFVPGSACFLARQASDGLCCWLTTASRLPTKLRSNSRTKQTISITFTVEASRDPPQLGLAGLPIHRLEREQGDSSPAAHFFLPSTFSDSLGCAVFRGPILCGLIGPIATLRT